MKFSALSLESETRELEPDEEGWRRFEQTGNHTCRIEIDYSESEKVLLFSLLDLIKKTLVLGTEDFPKLP